MSDLQVERLARSVGVSRHALYRWEHNRTVPSTTQLVALGRALGVPYHTLFTVVEAVRA